MCKRIFIKFLTIASCFSCCISVQSQVYEIDNGGYVAYCPCMGRFGNQVDHFLGALAFAHALNRTLILPPWVEYRKGQSMSVQVPFEAYFEIDGLKEYTKVISMENFMEHLSHHVWPPEKRISFCYSERKKINGKQDDEKQCNAKDGNPFFSFWDGFDIEFIGSEFYGPLLTYVAQGIDKQWNKKYHPAKWPVLAFTGAPATFPIQEKNIHLHKFLKWSDSIESSANYFLKTLLPKGAFIGIHLRNGIDWIKACEHIKDSKQLFSSAQCIGYNNEKGTLTMDMCFPTQEVIVRKIKRIIKHVKETQKTNEIKSVFVASDNNHMIEYLNEQLKRMKVQAFKLPENNPHVDLAILGRANYFIGNCVSSFSAFVKRERDSKGFSSQFFGYPNVKSQKISRHEEL